MVKSSSTVRIASPRVLIIEDEDGPDSVLLQAVLHAGFDGILATTGKSAKTVMQSFEPNIVLVDLDLPDTNVIDLIRWLVAQGGCGVIAVSGAASESDPIAILELGADDYIARPLAVRELLARIRAVHRRTVADRPATAGVLSIDRSARAVYSSDGDRIRLTGAEYMVFDLLSQATGVVVTRDHLSAAVLSRPWRPDDRSVDQLILTLRQKLATDDGADSPIQSIRGRGYLLRLSSVGPRSER